MFSMIRIARRPAAVLFVVLSTTFTVPAFAGIGENGGRSSGGGESNGVTLSTNLETREFGTDARHVLVMFDELASTADRHRIYGEVGGRVVNRFPWLNVDVVRLPKGMDLREAVRAYESRLGVTAASLNSYGYPLGAPDDPYFGYQWYLHNESQAIPPGNLGAPAVPAGEGKEDFDIDAPEGWELLEGRSTRTVRVAVLDTGIDILHPDFEGKVKACAQAQTGTGVITDSETIGSQLPNEIPPLACYDDYGHGTFVAGLIAGEAGNAYATAGIAPNVELLIMKVSDTNGRTMTADVIAGLRWAQQLGADIVNMSFSLGCDPDPVMEAALEETRDAGIFSVVAAGNLTCPLVRIDQGLEFRGGNDPTYPGAYDAVFGVGGTEAQGYVWGPRRDRPLGEPPEGSTCNETVDILAPAETIWTTVPLWANSDGADAVWGTSTAAPIVAGVAAQVLSVTDWARAERNEMLRTALLGSTTEVAPNPARDPSDCAGLGQVNLAGALEEAIAVSPLEVVIDIKPGSDENTINTRGGGSVPVAILTTGAFYALSVDIASITFGPGGAAPSHSTIDDVDADGHMDLLLHFAESATGVQPGDVEACLQGATSQGRAIYGCDRVTVR